MSRTHLLHHEVDRQAEWRPGDDAFVFEGDRYTYREFADRTRRAAALSSLGIGPGSVVAAHARNHVDLYTLFFACSRAGCLYTTVSTHQPPANVEYIADAIGPDAVFYTDDDAVVGGHLPGIRESLDGVPFVSLDEGTDDDPAFGGLLDGEDPVAPEGDASPDDRHNVFWTSGTTGRPKAAVRNHVDTLNFAKPLLEVLPFTPGGVRLMPRDMMYVAPYLQYGLPGFVNGETIVVLRSFTVDSVIEALETHDVSVTSIGFTMSKRILSRLEAEGRSIAAGRAHVVLQSREQAVRLFERLHDDVYHIYATTEAGLPLIRRADPDDLADPPLLGKPRPGTQLRLVDPDPDGFVPPDATVDPGDPGELIVRGTTTLTRYLTDEVHEENVHDGWVYTGDLFVRTAGELQFVGRVDNRLRSGGVNVYPEHVERVLEGSELVDQAVVVGVPDETWGDRISALIVPRDPSASLDELADRLEAHCLEAADLSRQLRPKEYRVVESADRIPTGALGKYDRDAIADLFDGS